MFPLMTTAGLRSGGYLCQSSTRLNSNFSSPSTSISASTHRTTPPALPTLQRSLLAAAQQPWTFHTRTQLRALRPAANLLLAASRPRRLSLARTARRTGPANPRPPPAPSPSRRRTTEDGPSPSTPTRADPSLQMRARARRGPTRMPPPASRPRWTARGCSPAAGIPRRPP